MMVQDSDCTTIGTTTSTVTCRCSKLSKMGVVLDPSVKICGDGVVDRLEKCDDGNNEAGDGCSTTCRVENGWACTYLESKTSECCGPCVASCRAHLVLFRLKARFCVA
jgi:cysteine-rich repeat protein